MTSPFGAGNRIGFGIGVLSLNVCLFSGTRRKPQRTRRLKAVDLPDRKLLTAEPAKKCHRERKRNILRLEMANLCAAAAVVFEEKANIGPGALGSALWRKDISCTYIFMSTKCSNGNIRTKGAYDRVKASESSVFCSTSCALAEPVEGLALGDRFTESTGRSCANRRMRGST